MSASVDFAYGGRLSLDFTWTLRFRAVRPTELLVTPERLVAWLARTELPVGRVSSKDHKEALLLREAVHAAASATIEGRPIRDSDLAVINRWASAEPTFRRLRSDGSKVNSVRRGRETEAALALIAQDAVDLISSCDGRLRRCEGPDCSLLFHDTSRPGNRRWCSAERCGNKVNTKNYRTRG